jgi:hypothetical protein
MQRRDGPLRNQDRSQYSSSFSIPIPIPMPMPTRAERIGQSSSSSVHVGSGREDADGFVLGIGIGIGIGIENSLMSSRAAASSTKLILTPRGRARRGWNTLHHGIPGCARRRCSSARARHRSRERRWRPSITLAGSGPADSPVHPDHLKWNGPSIAMGGGSGPPRTPLPLYPAPPIRSAVGLLIDLSNGQTCPL